MEESFYKTDSAGLRIDDIFIVDSSTSEIASALQLTDGTNNVRLDGNY